MLVALSHVLVVWAVVVLFSTSRVFLVLVFMNLEQLAELCFSNGSICCYYSDLSCFLNFASMGVYVCFERKQLFILLGKV